MCTFWVLGVPEPVLDVTPTQSKVNIWTEENITRTSFSCLNNDTMTNMGSSAALFLFLTALSCRMKVTLIASCSLTCRTNATKIGWILLLFLFLVRWLPSHLKKKHNQNRQDIWVPRIFWWTNSVWTSMMFLSCEKQTQTREVQSLSGCKVISCEGQKFLLDMMRTSCSFFFSQKRTFTPGLESMEP